MNEVRQFPTDELVGRVIHGRFRVLSLLARGGMGRVYRAEQLPLGRVVALKVLDRPAGTDGRGEFEQRFVNEASTAAKLHHSNTVTVFDYGRTDDGVCFIAMELVEGISLRDAIQKGAPFSLRRTAHIALQIARSLREAHRLDVIHRDLKPANVLLTRHDDDHDFVKVLDFGLVKHVDAAEHENLTREGLFLGSPKYMAPEQILNEKIDARADVYSLGVCMYEMLTGRPPFSNDSTVKILMAHMNEPAPRLAVANVPPAFADLVARCLAKDPAHRPASMDQVMLALKAALGEDMLLSGEQSVIARTPSLPPPPPLARAAASSRMSLPPVHAGPSAPAMAQAPAPQRVTATLQNTLITASPQQPPARPRQNFMRAAVIGGVVMMAAGLGLSHVQKTDTVIGHAAEASSHVKVLSAPAAHAAMNAVNVEADSGDTAHIFVSLVSTPSGAYVQFEGRRYGPTPASVEIEGPSVARGNEVTFIFEKPGYQSVRISRIVKKQNLSIETDLPAAYVIPDVRRARSLSLSPRVSAAAAPTPEHAPLPPPAVAVRAEPVAPTPPPAAIEPVKPAVAAVSPAPSVAAPAPVAPAPAPVKVARLAHASTPIGAASAPEYPRAARRANITGVVVARVYVRADGKVGNVEILEGHEVFHETVRAALLARRYEPARLTDGTAVADSHVVRIPFMLQ